MEGGNGAVQQAVACVRLCRYRQSAVLSRQHHDGAWRREEDDRGDRQVVVTRDMGFTAAIQSKNRPIAASFHPYSAPACGFRPPANPPSKSCGSAAIVTLS